MNPQVQSSGHTFVGHTVSGIAPKPSGLAVGDLMVIFVNFYDTGQTYAIPAGWSVIGGIGVGNGNLSSICKIADAGDVAAGGGPTISFGGIQTYANLVTIRITGFDPSDIFGAVNTASQGGVFTFTSGASVVPTLPHSLVLFSYGCIGSINNGMGNAGDTAFGTPEGTVTNVQNWVQGTPTQVSGTVVFDERSTTASTSGFTVNPGSNFADWVGLLVVINPLPAGGKQGLLSFLGR